VAMIWIMMMALEFKRVVFNYGFSEIEQIQEPGEKAHKIYGVLAYTFPLAIVVPQMLASSFKLVFLSFSLIIILLIFWTLVTYTRCAIRLRRMQQTLTAFEAFQELLIYPLILAGCWAMYVLVNLIVNYGSICSNPNSNIPTHFIVWLHLANGSSRAEAFLNVWAYLRTRSIWLKIREFYNTVPEVGSDFFSQNFIRITPNLSSNMIVDVMSFQNHITLGGS